MLYCFQKDVLFKEKRICICIKLFLSVRLLFLKQLYCYLCLHYDSTQGVLTQLIVPDIKLKKR